MNKATLRKEMLELRDSKNVHTTAELQKESLIICTLLFEAFSGYLKYGLYYSIKNEVNLQLLIDKLTANAKKVYLPKTNRENMTFGIYCGEKDLVCGYKGIPEPEEISVDIPDILFIPGLAFDKNGQRLGYGKGYYDRYLTDKNKIIKVGIAYKFQIVNNVYACKNDVKMDYIATGSGIKKYN